MGLLVIVLTIIPVILWMVYGKDDPVIPVVSFYPPKNRNSAEVEVEYSGDSTPKGVISLIFYLANKGYIEIDDDDINLTIKKVKPYDGNNKVEKAFMDGLFFGGKDVVTEIDLKISDVFTTYCSKISSALRRTLRVSLFNQDSCSFWKIALIILVIVGLFASVLYTLGDYSWALLTNEASMALLFPIIGTLVYAALLSTKNIATIAFGTIWAAGFIGMPMVMIVPMVQNFENNYPLFILEVLAIVVSVICLVNMPKRTEQGRRRLGEIMGFKKYLEVAEQKRIEDLIAENPNYCADVLPYAFILGVSDVWLKKISGLLNANPTWYKGTLNPERFNTFTSSLVSAATPVSSSGHSGGRSGRGHSGGGRSGGGHGGGGGGSW